LYLGKTIPSFQQQQVSLIILQGDTAQNYALFTAHLLGFINRLVRLVALVACADLGVYGVPAF